MIGPGPPDPPFPPAVGAEEEFVPPPPPPPAPLSGMPPVGTFAVAEVPAAPGFPPVTLVPCGVETNIGVVLEGRTPLQHQPQEETGGLEAQAQSSYW